jgi:D-alanyl-D-alanine carboxypeptidase
VSGVADLATGRPLSLDTPFAIASVSKTFLAAEVLLLVDAGRLSLDDAAARLLPKVRVGGAAIDPRITIRMLLDHTSGLGDYLTSTKLDAAVRADPLAVWTPEQSLAYADRPAGQPGTGYHYANTNYVLLGLIVEQVTGRTLAQEFRARFFDPLGLSSASYQGAEPPAAELPTAYRYSSTRLNAKPQDVTDGTDIRPFTAITTATGAAGSVAISARDLAHWARALYGGYVLPPDLLELMVADATVTQTLKPAYPYGLGVQVFTIDGRITYGHSGRLVGARSIVRWFPDAGVAIAIVTNQSRYDMTSILRDLLAIVAPTETGRGPLAG